MYEIISVGRKHYSEFKNLCIWKRNRITANEPYDDQHELIFVFKNGAEKHINNFGLGETGRYRTNVWNYAENNSGAKPVPLVADAILDCSHNGGIILDPFGGLGTTLITCEETDCKCYMSQPYLRKFLKRSFMIIEIPHFKYRIFELRMINNL